MNYLEKLREDFKVRFEDLEKMTVPDWIITPFDTEIENADIEFSLQEDNVDIIADLEAKLLFKRKSLSEYWSNINITTKTPRAKCSSSAISTCISKFVPG
ncbi:hypothetical protein T10_3672 [Trichinella papuae]|uniref:Zinc finger BED domain-containing protein 5 n=1 Tax=Trichinella papuae TaxID=268474 RepID=A0A0V1M926_9BILA|nr:hypothetical protein T10_3672 [Trichinella papuae]